MKALSEYESTLGKIEDSQSAIQDYKEKIQDAADAIVDAIQDGIEDMLEAMDTKREYDKMFREWNQGGSGYSHFNSERQYYEEGLSSLLSSKGPDQESVFDLQMKNLQERLKDAQDVFDGTPENADDEKLSEEAALENLQEATENLVDSLKTMTSYYDSLLDSIDEVSDKMDELIDERLTEFDDIEEYLDTRLDQVTLLFGNKSYEQQSQLYHQKVETNMAKMVSINTAIEAKQATVKSLEKLEASNKELSTEERETLKKAKEEVKSLQKEQLDTETRILQDLQNEKRATVTARMDQMIGEIFKGNKADGQGTDLD
jgi:chromosome segregation ATPase